MFAFSSEDNEDWVWDHFDQTPPMSTFTLGFLISEFQKLVSNATEEVTNADSGIVLLEVFEEVE